MDPESDGLDDKNEALSYEMGLDPNSEVCGPNYKALMIKEGLGCFYVSLWDVKMRVCPPKGGAWTIKVRIWVVQNEALNIKRGICILKVELWDLKLRL